MTDESLKMRVPVDVMRRLLGDDVLGAARDEAFSMSLEDPEGYAAALLERDFLARLSELMATSERVRLGEEVAARVAARTDEFLEEERKLIESWRTGA